MITVYTLKTCDTCKKALKWLDENSIPYLNKDVREDGISRQAIVQIVEAVGYDKAVNRRSTTWRNLDESTKSSLSDANAASLISDNPTLMKRPAFVDGSSIYVGFDKKVMERLSQ